SSIFHLRWRVDFDCTDHSFLDMFLFRAGVDLPSTVQCFAVVEGHVIYVCRHISSMLRTCLGADPRTFWTTASYVLGIEQSWRHLGTRLLCSLPCKSR